MGFLFNILSTAVIAGEALKKLSESDAGDKVVKHVSDAANRIAQKVTEKVSQKSQKTNQSENHADKGYSRYTSPRRKNNETSINERELIRHELLNAILTWINKDTFHEIFDNDRYQKLCEKLIGYCSSKDDLVQVHFFRYEGWSRVIYNAMESLNEENLSDTERQTFILWTYDANQKCLECLQEIKKYLSENNAHTWMLWMICCLYSTKIKELGCMNELPPHVRLIPECKSVISHADERHVLGKGNPNEFNENADNIEPKQAGNSVNTQLLLNEDEEKYKDCFLSCLNDGVLTEDDRQYLNWKMQRFGISPERAAEIENSCAPQLTDSEKEYLETFKEMTEGKEMTDRIRRILERERESLGITKERADELEKMQ